MHSVLESTLHYVINSALYTALHTALHTALESTLHQTNKKQKTTQQTNKKQSNPNHPKKMKGFFTTYTMYSFTNVLQLRFSHPFIYPRILRNNAPTISGKQGIIHNPL